MTWKKQRILGWAMIGAGLFTYSCGVYLQGQRRH